MAKTTMYSYLVAVQVAFKDTGACITDTVELDINFRITRSSVPVLLERLKQVLPKKDDTWKQAIEDPNTVLRVTAFSRYEEE